MKILRNISILAAAAGLFCGCQELEMVRTYAPEDVMAPALHSIMQGETAVDEITVTSENMGELVTFTWDAADFGVKTQINYAVEAAYGADTVVVLTGLTSTSAQTTLEVLNAPLALASKDGGLGIPVDSPTEVNFLVSATIGDTFGKYYSEGVPVMMTVTQAERTYPMIYVIGDFCGWADGQTQELFSFSGDETTYSGVIGFGGKASSGFKIRGTATGWSDDSNWGTDGNAPAPDAEAKSITLISSGGSGNISAYSKNFYRFSFNRSTLVLTNELSFDALYLVGSAAGLTWDSSKPENQMTFDTERQLFYIDYTLNEGDEIKVLTDNGTWFGGTADGGLNTQDNIKIPASGNYRVYINLNNPNEMTWELNAADYGTGGDEPDPEPEPETTWRVHGQTVEFPEWGDVEMVSASSNMVAYKAEGVEVAANSQFGFLDPDGQWYAVDNSFAAGANPYNVTVGTAFTVSTTATNANIVEAGTYDYWILPELGRGYVTETGVKPEYVPETYGICGTVNGWGDIGDLAMTEEGGYYVRKGVVLTTSDQFKIRYNNEWNDAANYGTESGGTVDLNTGIPVVSSGGSQNLSVTIDGTYDIYFDLENLLVYVMTAGTAPAE
ncbi:MAG: SusF/SusE family outer membrane protein [Bacteroidetes bacterium]|uniref:SusF/SusE family outer membrane protein n=1 Tax=Candidatus Cryptobacteroides avistercoris TaxID=2840758 RepID=A0A9D9IYY7_9BACT|nr:SusF/SusE family outer membrane protein [Candidatus Cryptobacteroides avistercoris]